MKLAVIREKIRGAGFYIPFRVHLLLLVSALLVAANWLEKNNAVRETARTAIINLFISVSFWFAISIIIFSFFSAFIPWIIFLFGKKNEKTSLKIETPVNNNPIDQQQVEINISHIIKPLFGYIRLRLLFDENNISPKFAPVSLDAGKHFLSMHLRGLYNWPLSNIKEYDVNSSIIYFEDFFQFFSFKGKLQCNSNFYTSPKIKTTGAVPVRPKKTEETNERIEEIRKVQGELLNYKNFENNDDVRRIVWKIYAKNKELVVKIPEIQDPYASHIYFYASFYDSISSDIYKEFNEVLLDNFKTVIWNIYDQLYRQNALIQYIPDQQSKQLYADHHLLQVKYIISTASWHKHNDLQHYFNKQNSSLLCVSSLTDPQQLSEILDQTGKSLTVVFVQLSKSFTDVTVTDWLSWIFVKPGKKSTEKLQLAFNLSPLRIKLTENEKRIKEMLKASDSEILII
jgi:hypothetical protein